MGIAKKIARNVVFPLFTGLKLEVMQRNFIANNSLILMYHGVVQPGTPKYNGRHLGLIDFEKHLEYYKKNFDIISLAEIFNNYRENFKPKKKTVAITFDDGYINNLDVALPILEKYQFPATYFVQGMSLEDENSITWPDVINILRSSLNVPIVYENYKFLPLLSEDFYDTTKKVSLITYIKNLDYKKRIDLFEFLQKQFDFRSIVDKINPYVWKLMGKEQLLKLSNHKLIEIGSHSYSHYCLGNIDLGSAKLELSTSKMIIENIIQKEVISLAYPDGSYNDSIKKLSIELGYKNLCAVKYQEVSDIDDKNILPRHGLSTTTTVSSNLIYLNNGFKNRGF